MQLFSLIRTKRLVWGWDEERHGLGQGEFLVDGLRQVEAVLNALDAHGTGVSQKER